MKLLPVLALTVCIAGIYAAGQTCDLCVAFVDEIAKVVAAEEPDIEQAANQICDQITAGHPTWDQYCKEFVDDQLQNIVSEIKNNQTSTEICHLLGPC